MTDTTTAPRCPSCGATMVSWTDGDGTTTWVCHRVHTPARVPCPACSGDGKVIAEVVDEYELVNDEVEPNIEIVVCPVCRGRATVPPALAAAWMADGERSSGGEG